MVSPIIQGLNDEFDSHQFIINLLKTHPAYYGGYLVKHDNVATADGEIARYLSLNSSDLNIVKIDDPQTEKYKSVNILGNESPCARWRKVKTANE